MLDSLALTLSDVAQTKRLAICLSQFIAPGRVFCLSGPLGSGKSELARAMITASCGPQDDIPSPTFSLVQPYLCDDGFEIWHMDLYRLETAEQALALGIEDAFYSCCCLIEWPDKLQERLPADQIRIDLAMGPDAGGRVVALAAVPEILEHLKQDYFS